MSAITLRIPALWSVDRGDVWHVHCCSASVQRSLPNSLHIFTTIFSLHATVGVLSELMCTYLCMSGTSVTSNTIHPNNKAVISKSKPDCVPMGFSMLSVMILPLGSIIASAQWITGPPYLPFTFLYRLPLMRLLMPFIMGPLASVLCIW